jgi:hypothetical protein
MTLRDGGGELLLCDKGKYHLMAGIRSMNRTEDGVEVYINGPGKRVSILSFHAHDVTRSGDAEKYQLTISEPSGLFLVKEHPEMITKLNIFLSAFFEEKYSLGWKKNHLVLYIGNTWLPITKVLRVSSFVPVQHYGSRQAHNPRPEVERVEEPATMRTDTFKISTRAATKPEKKEASCEGQFSVRLDKQYTDEEVAQS